MDSIDLKPVVVLQGRGIGPVLSAEEGRLQMARIIASRPPETQEEFLVRLQSEAGTAVVVAAKLGITLEALGELVATNRVLAMVDTQGELQFPLRQFDEHGPLQGMDAIAEHFAAQGITWDFLTSVCRMTNMKRPLDALRAGEVDLQHVISVAIGQSQGDHF